MISQLRAVQLARDIYAPVAPGVFDRVLQVGGIVAGVATVDGCTTVTFAGSENVRDWLRDLDALPFDHPQLGYLHSGFWQGMGDAWVALRPLLRGPLVICGHSLGAAHAAILAGLCAVNGLPVAQLSLFAPPRAGGAVLRNLVARHVTSVAAYRNGCDPIPQLPPALPLLEQWLDASPLMPLNVAPAEPCDVLAWHAIELYVQGIAARG